MSGRSLQIGSVVALALAVGLLWCSPLVIRTAEPLEDDGPSRGDMIAELVAPDTSVAPQTAAPIPGARAEAGEEAIEDPLADPPFRGQLVDAATRDPVFSASVVGGDLNAGTDINGRFDFGAALGSGVFRLRIYNPCAGTHIRDARRRTWELQEDGSWLIPIAVGPVFRLRLVAPPLEESESWLVRVVEFRPDGGMFPWGWTRLCEEGDFMWFRYDNPQTARHPGPALRLEVQHPRGTMRGSVDIAYSITGLHSQIPTLYVNELLGILRARVVDGQGNPRPDVDVLAIRLGGEDAELEERIRIRTSEDGIFHLQALTPGDYQVIVNPGRGTPLLARRLLVPAGETVLRDFVVPVDPPAGDVSGRVVSRAGELLPPVALRLRAIDGGEFDAWEGPNNGERFGGPVLTVRPSAVGRFRFEGVPAGEYELSVFSAGHDWSRRRVVVSPPVEDLTFVCEDEVSHPATFRVLAEDAGQLDEFLVQLHFTGMFEPESYTHRAGAEFELGPGVPLRWAVSAGGYVPEYGSERRFRDEGGVKVATVHLKKGWGAALLIREHEGSEHELYEELRGKSQYVRPLESPPVVGVEVWSNGELMGTSDDQGRVELESASDPPELELRAEGWRILGSEQFRDGRILGDAREVVVWMSRH